MAGVAEKAFPGDYTYMNNPLMGGVDIGGSHITAALVDVNTGTLINHSWQRNSVPAQGTAEAIIDAWSKVIADSCYAQQTKPARLGIAMPGPFDYAAGTCLIKNQHKYEALYGLNIKALLAEKLGIRKDSIVLTNDAVCFLQGEVFAGAAKGYREVIGLTLGTGLGSATYAKGKVEDAGWWNAPFKESIAEDYLSSRWFVNRYRQLTGKEVDNVKQLLSTSNETIIQTIFEEFGQHLALFLTPLLQQQPAALIVLGGNIAQAFALFAPALQSALQKVNNNTLIRPAALGEQAALIGAATAGLELSHYEKCYH